MKTFFLLCALIPFITAKVVETETERFECFANYLRDQNLLEKGFRYFTQNEQLECENLLKMSREMWLNETIDGLFIHSDTIEEQDEDTKAFKTMYLTNPDCFHQQLMELNYSDIVMKIYVYSKSNKLSKRLKMKYLAKVENENTKKILVASSICFPEELFGASFDLVFAECKGEVDESMEEKQTDYCIRKYVADNNLIDKNELNMETNPDHLDIASDFSCTDLLDDSFEVLEDQIKSPFLFNGEHTKSQSRCMNKAIRTSNAVDFMSRLNAMSEMKLSDQIKAHEKKKFIGMMTKLYTDMAKC